jgi:hypothetical protein
MKPKRSPRTAIHINKRIDLRQQSPGYEARQRQKPNANPGQDKVNLSTASPKAPFEFNRKLDSERGPRARHHYSAFEHIEPEILELRHPWPEKIVQSILIKSDAPLGRAEAKKHEPAPQQGFAKVVTDARENELQLPHAQATRRAGGRPGPAGIPGRLEVAGIHYKARNFAYHVRAPAHLQALCPGRCDEALHFHPHLLNCAREGRPMAPAYVNAHNLYRREALSQGALGRALGKARSAHRTQHYCHYDRRYSSHAG